MQSLPISKYQLRFLSIWEQSPTDVVCNLQYAFELDGNLNIPILKKSCGLVLAKNDIFHARFDNQTKTCVYCNYDIDSLFKIINTTDDYHATIRKILYSPLDLSHDPLLQFYLICHSDHENRYYFIIKSHHIVIDGVCARNVTKFIEQAYNSFLGYEPLPTSFNTYQEYLRKESLSSKNINVEKCKLFWQNFLSSTPLFTKIPTKVPVIRKLHPVEQIFFTLHQPELDRLRIFAKQNSSSIFVVIAALYGTLLADYAKQQKFAITYPVNIRDESCKTSAGSFINNIFFKFDFVKNPSLNELIQNLHSQTRESKQYRELPFFEITDALQREASDYINIGLVQGNINIKPLNFVNISSKPTPTFTKSLAYQMRLVYDQSLENSLRFRLDYAVDELELSFAKEFMDKLELSLLKLEIFST